MAIPFRLLALLFLISLAVRLFLAQQGLPYVDRIFVPDDTYYTLTISKSLARGDLPTAGGNITTSGFQPLLAFLQIPMHWLSTDRDWVLMASIFLSATVGALSTVPLVLLIAGTSSIRAAVYGGLIWGFANPILRSDLNGLDTALSGLCALSVVALFANMQRATPRPAQCILLGGLIGISLLARIDTCFLAIAIGVAALTLWPPATTCLIVVSALAIIGPWWAFLYAHFGSIVPESGAALHQIASYYADNGYTTVDAIALAASSIARIFLIDTLSIELLIVSTASIVVIMVLSYRLAAPANKTTLGVVYVTAAALVIFYVFVLPIFWFFERYFYFVFASIVISVASAATSVSPKNGGAQRAASPLSMAAIFFLIVGHCIGISAFLSLPKTTIETGYRGARGYREAALSILDALPENSRLGAMQSGALSYYAPPNVEVINLDGVVNRYAYQAIRSRSVDTYLSDERISHLADWEWNIEFINAHMRDVDLRRCMEPVSHSIKQGEDNFTLYRISPCQSWTS